MIRRLILVLLVAMVAAAQQTTPKARAQKSPAAKAGVSAANQGAADGMPTREEILKLFDALEVRQQLADMGDAMKTNMEQMQQAQMTDLSPAQHKKMTELNAEIFLAAFSPASVNAMLDDLVPIYQRHFTRNDVTAIINFYGSPVGQKLLHEQPQILKESMPTAAAHMQQRIEAIMKDKDYDRRMREIMSEEPPTPSKSEKPQAVPKKDQ